MNICCRVCYKSVTYHAQRTTVNGVTLWWEQWPFFIRERLSFWDPSWLLQASWLTNISSSRFESLFYVQYSTIACCPSAVKLAVILKNSINDCTCSMIELWILTLKKTIYFSQASWRSIYVWSTCLTSFFALMQLVLIFQVNIDEVHFFTFFPIVVVAIFVLRSEYRSDFFLSFSSD